MMSIKCHHILYSFIHSFTISQIINNYLLRVYNCIRDYARCWDYEDY